MKIRQCVLYILSYCTNNNGISNIQAVSKIQESIVTLLFPLISLASEVHFPL